MSIFQLPSSPSSAGSPGRMEGKSTIGTSRTGIYELLQGGIPRGKNLIYYTQPGVEGEVFGMQTAYNTLKNGGTCIFVTSSTSPGIIKNQFRELGMDIEPFKGRLLFVDAYSQLVGAPSREKYVVQNPDKIYNLNKAIISLLRRTPASTIVFGSLSTIMDLCGEKETIEAVRLWNRMASLYGHVLVYNFTAWPYSQEILSLIKKDLFDSVISIGGVTKNVFTGKYFSILRSDWMNKMIVRCFSGY